MVGTPRPSDAIVGDRGAAMRDMRDMKAALPLAQESVRMATS
jgi:hypothetical protein